MGPEVPRLSRRALRAGRGAPLLHHSGFEVAVGIQANYGDWVETVMVATISG